MSNQIKQPPDEEREKELAQITARISRYGGMLPLWEFWRVLGLFDSVPLPLPSWSQDELEAHTRFIWRLTLLWLRVHDTSHELYHDPVLSAMLPVDWEGGAWDDICNGLRPHPAFAEGRPGLRSVTELEAELQAVRRYVARRVVEEKWADPRVSFLFANDLAMGSVFMENDPSEEIDPMPVRILGLRIQREVPASQHLPVGVALDGSHEIPLAASTSPAEFWHDLSELWACPLPDGQMLHSRLLCFAQTFTRSPFFDSCPNLGGVGPVAARKVLAALKKELATSKRRWVWRPMESVIEGLAGSSILLALRGPKEQTTLGLLVRDGGWQGNPEEELTADEVALVRQVVGGKYKAQPPWRPLKSDLAIEDFAYPWDIVRPVDGSSTTARRPTEAPFAVDRAGLSVHTHTVLVLYALLKALQAAVPATARMTLATLSRRLEYITALGPAAPDDGVRVTVGSSDGDVWFGEVIEQVTRLG